MDIPLTEDILKLIAWKAVIGFGGQADGLFNSACYSIAFKNVIGVGGLSGMTIRAILIGRNWVDIEPDKCHWRLNNNF